MTKPPAAPAEPDLGEEPAVVTAAPRGSGPLQLEESRLEDVELSERLRGGSLADVAVVRGSWANANASGISLRRVEVVGARMTGAVLAEAVLSDVVFRDCRLDLASFRFAKLASVRFEGCRLEEADFYSASLSSVVFAGCNLTGASIAGVTLERVELRGCDLTAIGNPERLRGARMTWADVAQSADVLAAAVGIEIVE